MTNFPSLVTVSYSKRLKKVTLLRFLCSQIVYEVEKVGQLEVIALYDTLLWAQTKAQKDRQFRKIFGKNLELLAKILKNCRTSKSVGYMSLAKKLRRELIQLTEFLFPPRNFSTVKKRMSGNFHLIKAKQPGLEKKFLPPTKYLGKGYGDKGTLKNDARDGNPSWQEIATSNWYQVKILLEILENDKFLSFKEKRELQEEVLERLNHAQRI